MKSFSAVKLLFVLFTVTTGHAAVDYPWSAYTTQFNLDERIEKWAPWTGKYELRELNWYTLKGDSLMQQHWYYYVDGPAIGGPLGTKIMGTITKFRRDASDKRINSFTSYQEETVKITNITIFGTLQGSTNRPVANADGWLGAQTPYIGRHAWHDTTPGHEQITTVKGAVVYGLNNPSTNTVWYEFSLDYPRYGGGVGSKTLPPIEVGGKSIKLHMPDVGQAPIKVDRIWHRGVRGPLYVKP